MAKKNSLENPILIAVAAIAAIAPLYFVYKMFKKSIQLVKDPALYDLSEGEKSELKGLYPEYLKLSHEHENNLSTGLRINASGDFDRRSKAGQQAQSIKAKLESLRPSVDHLTLKPKLMFEQAISGYSEKASAFIALVIFCITALIQLQPESGQVAGENDSAIMAYLLGGLVSIPVYFVGKIIVGRILSAKFQAFQPPIVSYESLCTHRHVTSEPEKPEHEPIRKERMTANTGIDISNPNAPENKDLREQKAKGAIYYAAPSVFVGLMDDNSMSKSAMEILFADLVSKGWQPNQVKMLLGQSMKLYQSDATVETIAQRCKTYLQPDVMKDSMKTAFLVANDDGKFSPEEVGMLEQFLEVVGMTADQVLSE